MKGLWLYLRSNHGFTLIEMMIVLMIISILLLIAVPNMSKSHTIVNDKSCEATIKLVQSQIAAYEMETNQTLLELNTLVTNNYISSASCPDGTPLTLESGVVIKTAPSTNP